MVLLLLVVSLWWWSRSRSACCGAINGLLTGASILSAFLGLGLTVLLPGGGEGSTIAYAALTLAATSSEAVCMAIGLIWLSALAGDAARTECAKGERVFHSDRAQSKARLVEDDVAREGDCWYGGVDVDIVGGGGDGCSRGSTIV